MHSIYYHELLLKLGNDLQIAPCISDVVLGLDVLPRGCLEAHFLKPWPCLGFLRLGLGLALVLEEVSCLLGSVLCLVSNS